MASPNALMIFRPNQGSLLGFLAIGRPGHLFRIKPHWILSRQHWHTQRPPRPEITIPATYGLQEQGWQKISFHEIPPARGIPFVTSAMMAVKFLEEEEPESRPSEGGHCQLLGKGGGTS